MASSNPTAPTATSANTAAPLANARSNGGSNHLNQLIAMARRTFADGTLFFAIATIAVWMLSRSFQGIEGDGRVYMARALADVDPNGVGRDFMFVYDGQAKFSVFTFVAQWLVGALNPANTSLVFALVNSFCWIAAALFFISRFAQGRMKWAILMIVAAMPNAYGPFSLLRFGEQYAVPRPLTEACVLVALAFLADGRRLMALAFLACAVAFHPIMALPGLVIFGVDLCRSDRRWIFAGLTLGLIAIVAAALGLPLFDRLATPVDPEWLDLLRIRNPYLFPTQWPPEPFGFLALELATIAIAANLFGPKLKFIFWAVAGAGAGGMLIALTLGDLWPLLLVVQAQLWRMTWLTGAVAAMSLALCLLDLGKRGPRVELATTLLVFGWLFVDEFAFTLFAGCTALLLYHLKRLNFSIGRPILNTIWLLILAAGLVVKIRMATAYFNFTMAVPEGGHSPFALLWNFYLFSVPVIILAVAWTLRIKWLTPRAMGAFSAAAALFVIFLWDDRPIARKMIDSAQRPADLAALFPADHSEIYWVGGMEPWYLLGHPNWLLRIQGAGIVFSRPLAMLWQERIKALVSMKLADANILGPWTIPTREDSVELTHSSVGQLCARADAPSRIVAAIEEGSSAPSDLKFKTWKPIAPQFRLQVKDEGIAWRRIETFIVISCTDYTLERQASVN